MKNHKWNIISGIENIDLKSDFAYLEKRRMKSFV